MRILLGGYVCQFPTSEKYSKNPFHFYCVPHTLVMSFLFIFFLLTNTYTRALHKHSHLHVLHLHIGVASSAICPLLAASHSNCYLRVLHSYDDATIGAIAWVIPRCPRVTIPYCRRLLHFLRYFTAVAAPQKCCHATSVFNELSIFMFTESFRILGGKVWMCCVNICVCALSFSGSLRQSTALRAFFRLSISFIF